MADDAEAGLSAGMQYVDAIKNRRIRVATALPALIGMRTIEELRGGGRRNFSAQDQDPAVASAGDSLSDNANDGIAPNSSQDF